MSRQLRTVLNDIMFLSKCVDLVNVPCLSGVLRDIRYLDPSSRKSSFGVSRGELSSWFEENKPDIDDSNETIEYLTQTLRHLRTLKSKYDELVDTNTVTDESVMDGTNLPEYTGYTPRTKLEIELLAKPVVYKLSTKVKYILKGYLDGIPNSTIGYRTREGIRDLIRLNQQGIDQIFGTELREYYEYPGCVTAFVYVKGAHDGTGYNPDLHNVLITSTQAEILKQLKSIGLNVKTFDKEKTTQTHITHKKSEIVVSVDGWTVFRVFVLPVENLANKSDFRLKLTNSGLGADKNDFNNLGYIISLLEQLHQEESSVYYEDFLMIRFILETMDIKMITEAVTACYTNSKMLIAEIFNKNYPEFIKERNTEILNIFTPYIFYLVNYLNGKLPEPLVLSGGNSILAKLQQPIENDLDFTLYTTDYESVNEILHNELANFMFYLEFVTKRLSTSTVKKSAAKFNSTINLQTADIKLRVMNSSTPVYKQYSIVFNLQESFKEPDGKTLAANLDLKYTLLEITVKNTPNPHSPVKLNLQFNSGQLSTNVYIDSLQSDVHRLNNINHSRSEYKRQQDIPRIRSLVAKYKSYPRQRYEFNEEINDVASGVYKCTDFNCRRSEFVYSNFEAVMAYFTTTPGLWKKRSIGTGVVLARQVEPQETTRDYFFYLYVAATATRSIYVLSKELTGKRDTLNKQITKLSPKIAIQTAPVPAAGPSRSSDEEILQEAVLHAQRDKTALEQQREQRVMEKIVSNSKSYGVLTTGTNLLTTSVAINILRLLSKDEYTKKLMIFNNQTGLPRFLDFVLQMVFTLEGKFYDEISLYIRDNRDQPKSSMNLVTLLPKFELGIFNILERFMPILTTNPTIKYIVNVAFLSKILSTIADNDNNTTRGKYQNILSFYQTVSVVHNFMIYDIFKDSGDYLKLVISNSFMVYISSLNQKVQKISRRKVSEFSGDVPNFLSRDKSHQSNELLNRIGTIESFSKVLPTIFEGYKETPQWKPLFESFEFTFGTINTLQIVQAITSKKSLNTEALLNRFYTYGSSVSDGIIIDFPKFHKFVDGFISQFVIMDRNPYLREILIRIVKFYLFSAFLSAQKQQTQIRRIDMTAYGAFRDNYDDIISNFIWNEIAQDLFKVFSFLTPDEAATLINIPISKYESPELHAFLLTKIPPE